MKNAQNLLFDLDGTLSDPKEGITKSIVFALEKMGIEPPPLDDLIVCIGPPLRLSLKTMLQDNSHERIEQAISFFRQRYVHEGRGVAENILFDGIEDALEQLNDEGKCLYVATSKAIDIAESIIENFNLKKFFKKIYGAELDGTRSDKGELIAHILQSEKLSPENSVMIGDREHDIIGASKNGLSSVGVLWGYGSEDELRKAGATRLCGSRQDLPSLFL